MIRFCFALALWTFGIIPYGFSADVPLPGVVTTDLHAAGTGIGIHVRTTPETVKKEGDDDNRAAAPITPVTGTGAIVAATGCTCLALGCYGCGRALCKHTSHIVDQGCSWACSGIGSCLVSCGVPCALGTWALAVRLCTSSPLPPMPTHTLVESAVREAVDITSLNLFFQAGSPKHPPYPFGVNPWNTVVFSKENPPSALSREQWALISQGIGRIVLELPFSLRPLAKLANQKTAAQYTLHFHGEFGWGNFRTLKKAMEAWSKTGKARCQGLDFAVHMPPSKLVTRLEDLFQYPAAQVLTSLSLRLAALRDSDVITLYNALEGRAPNLEVLVLTSNNITAESMEIIRGCCTVRKGGILSFVQNKRGFPDILKIDLRGNPLGKIKDPSSFTTALGARSAAFRIHIGFNGDDTLPWRSALADRLTVDPDATFGPFPSQIGKVLWQDKYHPILNEDPSTAVLAQWPAELLTIAAYGKQPLQALVLDGTRLNMVLIASVLASLDPKALTKLSLKGTFEEGGDVEANNENVLKQLKRLSRLTSLEMGDNFAEVSDKTVQAYGVSLKDLHQLTYLGWSGNNLDNNGGAFLTHIQSLKDLLILDLSNNGLKNEYLPLIAATTSALTQLVWLNLSSNNLTNLGPFMHLLGITPPIEDSHGAASGDTRSESPHTNHVSIPKDSYSPPSVQAISSNTRGTENPYDLVSHTSEKEKKKENNDPYADREIEVATILPTLDSGVGYNPDPADRLEAPSNDPYAKTEAETVARSAPLPPTGALSGERSPSLKLINFEGNPLTSIALSPLTTFYDANPRAPLPLLTLPASEDDTSPSTLGNPSHYAALSHFITATRTLPFGFLASLPALDVQNLLNDPKSQRQIMLTLARMLSKAPTLTALNFSDNNLTLKFDGNVLDPEFQDPLASLNKILAVNTTLQDLNLSHMNLGPKILEMLPALKTLTRLTGLELGNNALGAGTLKDIASIIGKFSTLTTLNLRGNQLGKGIRVFGGGIRALNDVLKGGSFHLQTLNLSHNNLGPRDINSLNEGLQHQSTLTTLDIGFNPLRDKGSETLAALLRYLPLLEDLRVPSIGMTAKGTPTLVESLKPLTNLTFLDLHGHGLGEKGREIFAEVTRTSGLTVLGN